MKVIKLSKGYDIRLTGKSKHEILPAKKSNFFAMSPANFRGLRPKLDIEEGALVKAGETLFHDKLYPEVKFTATVSGRVSQIIRGERRIIESVVIESDAKFESKPFDYHAADTIKNLDSESVKNQLLESGLWPLIVERPYGRIANPKHIARDIFISAFDTAPLAADPNLMVENQAEAFQAGVDALSRLTSGKIYLSVSANGNINPIFKNTKNVELIAFEGKHPAGNVGIQIHHIKPINRGDIVFTIKPVDVIAIGRLFLTGQVTSDIIVAVAGENADNRVYFKTKRGALISDIISQVKENSRIISGNVLTGSKTDLNKFLGFTDNLITVIPEGNEHVFLGWVKPNLSKESFSGTFVSKFFPKNEYSHNTNLKGGHRNFVQTGLYEQVLPMDIYPMHLFKAMLSEDIELMEGLGVYEILEEDVALCEYICPSKVEIQEIVSDAIELMIKETAVVAHH